MLKMTIHIEYRCSECNKLLFTYDRNSLFGIETVCPKCKTKQRFLRDLSLRQEKIVN